MVLKVMVEMKLPSVVTDDVKLAVIMEVLTVVMEVLTVVMEVLAVVMLVIREAPEVAMEGAQVEKEIEIVVEGAAMILAVKVAAKQAEILDMDPKVL